MKVIDMIKRTEFIDPTHYIKMMESDRREEIPRQLFEAVRKNVVLRSEAIKLMSLNSSLKKYQSTKLDSTKQ